MAGESSTPLFREETSSRRKERCLFIFLSSSLAIASYLALAVVLHSFSRHFYFCFRCSRLPPKRWKLAPYLNFILSLQQFRPYFDFGLPVVAIQIGSIDFIMVQALLGIEKIFKWYSNATDAAPCASLMRPTEAEGPNTVSQCSPYPVPILYQVLGVLNIILKHYRLARANKFELCWRTGITQSDLYQCWYAPWK